MRFFTSSVMRPADETELARLIGEAAAERMPIEFRGGGTKRGVGRAVQVGGTIDMSGFGNVLLYEPSELVMATGAGASLAAIEQRLAENRQMLAFEPIDLGPMSGLPAGQGTIGGAFLTNLSGSRRISAGAARDHLLGLRAVNGRGEAFKNGGRVMKNVTGYDLCRGLAGSWGTLAAVSEVTFKVLPMPEETRTLVMPGLHDDIASEIMCTAMGTPFEVTAAIHLQSSMVERLRLSRLRSQATSLTALRLENFPGFVDYRAGRIKDRLAAFGEIDELNDEISRAFWQEIRELSFLCGSDSPVWRISTTPTKGPRIVQALAGYMDCRAAYDWSGGLIWLEVPPTADAGATDIRRVIASHGGHATLMRADPGMRALVDVFQPLDPALQRLSKGLKSLFDPVGILNPGRMYADA